MFNQRTAILEGNLVKDPTVKTVGNDKTVSELTIAVNHEGRDESSKVSYFDIEAWDGVAQASSSLRKGMHVTIYGNLKQDRWEKDGKIMSKIKVIAQAISPRHPAASA